MFVHMQQSQVVKLGYSTEIIIIMYVCIVCITMCSLVICINCNLCYITLFNTITLHYAWLWQLLEC